MMVPTRFLRCISAVHTTGGLEGTAVHAVTSLAVMTGHSKPINRDAVRGEGAALVALVLECADPSQCAEWIRFPLECAMASGGNSKVNQEVLHYLGESLISVVLEKASPEQWAQWLRVALEHTLRAGTKETVKKLLEAGADISAGVSGVGDGALMLAACKGCDAHAKVDMMLDAGYTGGVDVPESGSKKRPLHFLAGGDSDEAGGDVIQRLCDHGADVNARDAVWRTPLHLAAETDNSYAVSALLKRKANPNIKDGALDCTPLALAVKTQSTLALRALLADENTDVNMGSINGPGGPIHIATLNGNLDMTCALLERGATTNDPGMRHATPLHLAALKDHAETVDYLLTEPGVVVGATDEHGMTPLHYAATDGSVEAVGQLLRAGADVDAKDAEGRTPLHVSARGLRENAIKVLLQYDADETIATGNGETMAELVSRALGENLSEEVKIATRTRIHDMLSRAPADCAERKWRRRSWLLKLRVHVQTAIANVSMKEAQGQAGVERAAGAQALGAVVVGEGVEAAEWEVDDTAMVPASENLEEQGEMAVRDTVKPVTAARRNSCAAEGPVPHRARREDARGRAGGHDNFRQVAMWTAALSEEGIFKNVVAFL